MAIIKKGRERDLFSVKSGKKKNSNKNAQKKSKQTKKRDPEDQLEIEFRSRKKDGDTGIDDNLSFENISEGQVVLGCIAEVRQYELIVSLPHKLVGSVPITNISESYRVLLSKIAKGQEVTEEIHSLEELYPIGHFIIVRVKNVVTIADTNRVKITLSILPGDVNFGIAPYALMEGSILQCSIESVEDHGYVLNTGIANLRSAFMLQKGAPKNLGFIGIGSVMICAVKQIDFDEDDPKNTVRIKVTSRNKYISKNILQATNKTSVGMLLPGTLLDAVVDKVNELNLEISTAFLKGVVWIEHLFSSAQKPSDYKVGQCVKARILYVTNLTHVIHFTLNPNICSSSVMANPYNGFAMGEVVNNAKIIKNTKNGIYLRLREGCNGFCSSFNLKDTPVLSFANRHKEFPVGSVKTCRIIKYSFMEQMFIVSLKKSVITDQVRGTAELQVGQVVDVQIKSQLDKGAVVALGSAVNGFVPFIHLTNSNMSNPWNKCPVGHTCKARILKNDPGDRGPILTLKSSLIKSNLPIIQDFEESNVGVITEGVVSKIENKGMLIELYGGAKGFMPIKLMTIQETDKLSEIYKVGQILRCKVKLCDNKNKRMILSTKFSGVSKKETSETEWKLNVGDAVNGKVISIESDNVIISVKNSRKGLKFIIPIFHLSDDIKLCDSLIKYLKVGDIISNGIVFSINRLEVIISLKPIIYVWMMVNSNKIASNLKTDEVIPAVVKEVSAEKLLVCIMNGKQGLKCPLYKNDVIAEAAEMDDLTFTGITKGQTILVKCLKLQENGIPHISSCWEDVKSEVVLPSLQLLYNSLASVDIIKSAFINLGGDFTKFSEIKIGNIYEARVEIKYKDCVLVNILHLDIDGVVSSAHLDPSLSFNKGNIITVRVLYVDYKNHCIELTTKKNIKKLYASPITELQVGQHCTCEVLLAKREFIMCRLKSTCVGQVVYLPTKRHINDFKGRQTFYEVGKRIDIIIRFINNSLVLADFHYHCVDSNSINIQETFPSIAFKKGDSDEILSTLSKNRENYTEFDFKTKAYNKVKEVTQMYLLNSTHLRNMKLSYKEKCKILKHDHFSNFDEKLYWMFVLEERRNRKKLKKRGLLPSNKLNDSKKRKNNISSDNESSSKKMKTDTDLVNEEELSATESEQHETLEISKCLPLKSKGFIWEVESNIGNEEHASSSEDDEIEEEQKSIKKLSKEEKLQSKLEMEQRVRELELQRKNPERPLETALDYEELLQKNSSSSVAWVQYISYHLACAEVEKARAVAQRALKAILPSKEEDRLVIWSTILRLEVLFGSPETVEKVFKEAVVTNDEIKIYEEMAKIYADVNKMKEADDIFHKMTKKFSKSMNVWINTGQFNYKNNRLKEARILLEKSLLSLPKQEHIEIINRFAQFEFRYGEAERGRTMFESILSNFPKRMDIWIVYADLLTKQNDIEGARNVFERMANLNLKPKQMRTIFKKLLNFEQKHGNPHTVQLVKTRVEDYVSAALEDEGSSSFIGIQHFPPKRE